MLTTDSMELETAREHALTVMGDDSVKKQGSWSFLAAAQSTSFDRDRLKEIYNQAVADRWKIVAKDRGFNRMHRKQNVKILSQGHQTTLTGDTNKKRVRFLGGNLGSVAGMFDAILREDVEGGQPGKYIKVFQSRASFEDRFWTTLSAVDGMESLGVDMWPNAWEQAIQHSLDTYEHDVSDGTREFFEGLKQKAP